MLLGRSFLEMMTIRDTVEKIRAREKHNHESHHEEEDNQISLAGPHTVELEQRENEQTKYRQLSDKAAR